MHARPCPPSSRPRLAARLAMSLIAGLLALALSPPPAAGGEAPALPTLLAQARAAVGGEAWAGVENLALTVELRVGGLVGEAEIWEDLRTCRSTSRFELGPIHGRQGFDGEDVWQQDSTGQVHVDESENAGQGARNEAYLRCQGLFDPELRGAEVTVRDRQIEGERGFDVLTVSPPGGRPFEVWLDGETHLIDRTVEHEAIDTRTTFFSDYREVGGLVIAHHQRSTNGDERYDQVALVRTVTLDPELPEGHYTRPKSEALDVLFPAGKTSTTLPFELHNNHIYIEARVNGRGPLTLLVDTGGANILTPAAAAELGLRGEGAFQVGGVGEQREEMSLTRVDELALGEVRIREQVFAVVPLRDLDRVEGVDLDGLIGFEVFKRFAVEIDYEGRRLTLIRPEAFRPPEGATAVPFTFDGSTPQAEGALDGIAGLFTIDTGSRSTLTLHAPFTAEHGLVEKYGAETDVLTGWGLGGGVRSRPARAGLFRLGPEGRSVEIRGPGIDLFTDDHGAFKDRYVAGNVGGGLLRRFTVTFDYGAQLMYLVANRQAASPFPGEGPGLWLNWESFTGGRGEALRVEDVTPGSPAEEAGLAVGDRILGVDGHPVPELTLSTLRERLKTAPPGTVIRFTVAGDEGEREVAVTVGGEAGR